jgi:hypothetical protein
MKFKIYVDFKDLALPLHVEVNGNCYFSIHILFLDFTWFPYVKEVEISPEEELKALNEYCDEQLKMIADEREEIMKKMGAQTR